MIKNIKRLGMTDSDYPLYKAHDSDSYPICFRFNIGFAAAGSSGKRQGLYEVTEAVNKQTFKIEGDRPADPVITGRPKLKSEMAAVIAAGLLANPCDHNDVPAHAVHLAESILKEQGL